MIFYFFYITKTVKGIVGVGKVETKFIQDKPLWPDEIAAGKVIYPFRFEFHIDYLLEEKDWKDKKYLSGYLFKRCVEELIFYKKEQ